MPIVHSLVRDCGLADVCQLLSVATELGMSLPDAVEEAARLRINPVLQQRVHDWAVQCCAGFPVHETAVQSRMPKLFTGILSTAEKTTSMSQALEFLNRHYASRFSRTRQTLESAMRPLVVLAFGIPTAFFVIAFFQPLVEFLERAALDTGLL